MNYIIKSPETELEWDKYFNFRWEKLRKPLGMSKNTSKDELEDESFHLIVLDEEKQVIGGGRLHFNRETEGQIRYMAVTDSFQRKGIGSEIVTKLEEHALSQGVKEMTLNARDKAISFYLSLGYEEKGPYKSDTGIPHKTMMKRLV
ncbi:MAG: GNAT family N-acetyltransferase [SAR86 cluster bacterium]|jgi:N-acetylglutamate synthase-like GNAT family acetyltransferase|nr:GNAT family N-acetyltransferase [SAR86 cluster bacterium]